MAWWPKPMPHRGAQKTHTSPNLSEVKPTAERWRSTRRRENPTFVSCGGETQVTLYNCCRFQPEREFRTPRSSWSPAECCKRKGESCSVRYPLIFLGLIHTCEERFNAWCHKITVPMFATKWAVMCMFCNILLQLLHPKQILSDKSGLSVKFYSYLADGINWTLILGAFMWGGGKYWSPFDSKVELELSVTSEMDTAFCSE